MTGAVALETKIFPFPSKKKALRKAGLNRNRKGSVRSINGKLYVDFIYLGERVREKTGLDDTKENGKQVRQQLDRIIMAIESGTFRFTEVFPQSQKKDHFKDKENEVYRFKKAPGDVNFQENASQWYSRLKDSGRVAPRTLYGYKSYLENYLFPFFGKMTFGDLDLVTFDNFIGWAKKQQFREKSISNETVNKIFVPLKTICMSAKHEFKWIGYDPFDDFKKLSEGDSSKKIMPFSIQEQKRLIESMPDHWKPYFLFAFCTGLRQGEQIGLKPCDIDWEQKVIHVRRGMTLDENGKKMEGPTKNCFSQRDIDFTPVICRALKLQMAVYGRFNGEYFFCSPEGRMVNVQNLARRVWGPSLRKAKIPFREMKQTRHSFATMALSYGENPLWVASTLGHRDTDMVIKVYSKFVKNASGSVDGGMLNKAYQFIAAKDGES